MTVSIDVWSDIACPWCWIGLRRLQHATEGFEDHVAIRWHAFQLDPAAPREAPASVDYVGRLAGKYGTSRAEAGAMIDRMVATGREEGVEMRFDLVRPSNTFDAHRLLAWAPRTGRGSDLASRLFLAYLGEGRSMSDVDELARLAGEIGLDPREAAEILAGGEYAADVRTDLERARGIGITGVPFFLLDGRLAIAGAHPAAVLRDALRRIRAEHG